MPIIPIYERKENIIPGASNVLMPTETPADIRAMQNLGATGINVGEQITAAAERMEAREKAGLLETELNKADADQLEMILKAKEVYDKPGTNPYGVFKETGVALEKYNENALTNADPRITEALRIKLDNLKNINLKHVATWQSESQQRYDTDVRSNIVTNAIKRGSTFGDSPSTVEETYNDMLDRLKTNYLGKEVPEIVKNKATVAYASGVIQATIASGQVEYAKAYMERWAGELKGAQVYDELHRQMKSIAKDQNNTQAYSDLYDKFNGDLNRMSLYLEDPKHQKEYGLDLEGASYVKKRISEAITDRHVAEVDTTIKYGGAIEDAMSNAWAQGRILNIDKVTSMPEYKKLEEMAATGNKTAIKEMQHIKNKVNDQNSKVFSNIGTDLMDAQKLISSTVTEIREEGRRKGLSAKDITKLEKQRLYYLEHPEDAQYAIFKTDTVKSMLEKAGIKQDEQNKLAETAATFLYAEEKKLGRNLTSDEAQATIIKGLQHVIVNERESFMGINLGLTKTQKHLMEVKNRGAILSPYDDTLPEKKPVKTINTIKFDFKMSPEDMTKIESKKGVELVKLQENKNDNKKVRILFSDGSYEYITKL
jgi:hypothetical protein